MRKIWQVKWMLSEKDKEDYFEARSAQNTLE